VVAGVGLSKDHLCLNDLRQLKRDEPDDGESRQLGHVVAVTVGQRLKARNDGGTESGGQGARTGM
jgi:hypothetical protein